MVLQRHLFAPWMIVWVFCVVTDAVPVGHVSEFDKQMEKNGQTWALLVAGSKGYGNYRHQADICHAYQVLRNRGMDANQIITMFYDDVAHSLFNPYKHQLFNEVDPVQKLRSATRTG